MDFITEWITNIILFVLLATVLDMLLPNSNFQKYAKMVTGLLLIAIILTPILKFFSSDFEAAVASIPVFESQRDQSMGNLIEMQKKEIQASQHAYILEQMAVDMETDAKKELMDQYGLEIVKIDVLVDEQDQHEFPENLQKVIVQLKYPDAGPEAVEAVKKIEINTEQPLPSKRPNNQTSKIVSLLSQKWNVNESTIEVTIEGGNTKVNGQG
ncbi:stage III sporulation protein AF [Bacillus canaveralius]|uniref:Stage III sporulation protein AF n=1 Tax=Bacillus canaveralius TaxID=1403243 RepID=A0A2N5GRC8_9BACI|nr:stage III sporulation protein AF [Bacillus canaveralius]PLR85997.1 stage III sporulation protein AF [Bacillus canaveralius]PLS00116.1 stage III sporulation protein AF [Bacillus canaveralius]